MPTEPLVSVLIGAYDEAPTIGRAVASVLAQSLSEIELIVIDNGSVDGTQDAALAACAGDPRARVLRLEENVGIARSLNAGMREAQAPFVAILDADDEATPDRLARQLAALRAHPEVAVVGARSLERDHAGRPLVPRNRFRAGDVTRLVWSYNPIPNGTAMVRRDVVLAEGGYDPRYQYAMEYDLWLRLIRKHRLHALDDALVVRYVGGGVSNRFERRQIAEGAVLLARNTATHRNPRGVTGFAHCCASLAAPLTVKRALRRRRGMAP